MKEKKILVLLPVTEEDKEYLISKARGAARPHCSQELRVSKEPSPRNTSDTLVLY